MATVPSSFGAGRLQPVIPVNQSIYEGDTTQRTELGTKLSLGDRVFYYAQASASLGAGSVVCGAQLTASHGAGILVNTAGTVDSFTLALTVGTTCSANQYAEGYLAVVTGTAQGVMYRVKSHGAAATSGKSMTVTLYDPLIHALTSGLGCALVPNIYKNVFVGSEAVGLPVGVVPVDVTSGSYFWLQSWGPSAPVHQAASAAAAGLKLGTTGGVAAAHLAGTTGTAVATIEIGKNFNIAATAAEADPIFLMIRP